MVEKTMTAAEQAVARLAVGGFNSRSLAEALLAPRAWDDVRSILTKSDASVVGLWDGSDGDKLIQFEDQSYVYYFGCTGGTWHIDTPCDLALEMSSIDKEMYQWPLTFRLKWDEHGCTIQIGDSLSEESNAKPVTTHPQLPNSQVECNNEN